MIAKQGVFETKGPRIVFEGSALYRTQVIEKINSLGGMDYIKKLIP